MLNLGCQPCSLYSEDFFCSSLKLFGSIRIAYGFIARLASDYNEKGWNIYQPLFFNFIIIAFAIFMMIKALNKVRKPEEKKAGPTSEDLLTEIRDLLKNK